MTSIRQAAAVAILALTVVSPARADCRADLVTVSQTVERTRAELKDAAAGAKCAAYRRHIAALTQVRDVFIRCDTGAEKAKNAAQVRSTVADVTKQMQQSCKR